MDTIVSVAIVVLCGSVAAFFLYAIGALRRTQETLVEVSKSMEAVTTEVTQFSTHLTPVLDNLKVTTDNIRDISDNVAAQVQALKNVADVVNHFANDVREFEKEFKNRIQDPVLDGAQYVKAAARGIKAFISVMRRD